MSFADTYSAATASIVVSPGATATSCIGPQLVGVIVPEKAPLPIALAEPANTVIMKAAAAAAAIVRPGRKLTCPPDSQARTPGARGNSAANIPRLRANGTFYISRTKSGFRPKID